jgi:hypothetical protein
MAQRALMAKWSVGDELFGVLFPLLKSIYHLFVLRQLLAIALGLALGCMMLGTK